LFKWLLAVLGVVVLLLAVAALVLPRLIDPNDYKQEISGAVHSRTGRDLEITGDIKWSVFPWIGLDLNDISLSNPPGFGDQPMLTVGKVSISVKLLPLFHGALEFGSVEFSDLSAHLRRNAQGITNWDDLVAASSQPAPTPPTKAGEPHAFKLAAFDVSHANITWDDAGEITMLKDLSVETSRIESGHPFDLKGAFSVNVDQPALAGRVDFAGRIMQSAGGKHYDINNLEMTFKGHQGAGAEALKLDLDLDAEAAIDLGAEQVVLRNLHLKLGRANGTGSLQFENFNDPKLGFDLELDQLNLDDYMTQGQSDGGDSTAPVVEVPAIRIAGKLQVGQLALAGLKASQVKLAVNSDGKRLSIDPVNARVYGGTLAAKATIDSRGGHPNLAASQQLKGIRAGDLLQDLAGSARLTGLGDFNMNIGTDLSSTRSAREALAGHFDLEVHDGAINGIDITDTLRKANALLGRQTVTASATEDGKKTPFSRLSMTATIKRGIVSSDDLVLSSPLLRMTGKGQVDLVNETIDYEVAPTLEGSAVDQLGPQLDKLRGKPIPLKLSGSLYQPKIKVDIAAAIGDAQKAKITAKTKALEKKVLGKLLGEKDSGEAGDSGQNQDNQPQDNGGDEEKSKTSAEDLLKGLLGSKRKKDGQEQSADDGSGP
jgi:AsmA protein